MPGIITLHFLVEILPQEIYLCIKGGTGMAQIMVAQNVNGIVLAGENRAMQLDETGKEIQLDVNRLLPLTSHAVLL